jgi:short-subunit dehydrogenase
MAGKNPKIIVCGSSVTTGTPPAGMLNYVAAKGMLRIYCKALNEELKQKNISVFYLAPRMFRSRLLSLLPEYFVEKYCADNNIDIVKDTVIPTILSVLNEGSFHETSHLSIVD